MDGPRGIIFDLFDTVLCKESVDTFAGVCKLLQFTTNQTILPVAEILLLADELNNEVEQIRNESTVEFNFQSFERMLFENLGLAFKLSYAEMERVFWHASVKYRPADGISRIIEILEEKKIRTGILTNSCFSGKVLKEELVKHNLASRFNFVVSSADYGFRKPNPRIFQIAIKKLNLDVRDIWFAGDKIGYDMNGAFNSGLYPVWYNPLGESVTPSYDHLMIRNWHELAETIKKYSLPKEKGKITIA